MANKVSNTESNKKVVIQEIREDNIIVSLGGKLREIQNEMVVLREFLKEQEEYQLMIGDKVVSLSQLGEEESTLRKTFNVLLTKRLIHALADNGLPSAQKFISKVAGGVKGWENIERYSNGAKMLIQYAFVGILGVQLRKIIAIGKESNSEYKQKTYIDNCYYTAIRTLQITTFTLISDLWDKQKEKNYPLLKEERDVLNKFFEAEIENDLKGYLKLLKILLTIFKRYELDLVFPDLEQLDIERLEVICNRIQKIKAKLDQSQQLLISCFEMESQLTSLLEQFVFFINYKMLSVKKIAYDELRITPPQYVYYYVELGVDEKFNINPDKIKFDISPIATDAVFIYQKGIEYNKGYNLSPFIIDYNTLVLEEGTKICFYSARHPLSDRILNYYSLEDNKTINIEFRGVEEEHSDLTELLRDTENYKKMKLDNVVKQFNEANQTIIENLGEEDNFSLNDLIG